jgi:hypothetical protein
MILTFLLQHDENCSTCHFCLWMRIIRGANLAKRKIILIGQILTSEEHLDFCEHGLRDGG